MEEGLKAAKEGLFLYYEKDEGKGVPLSKGKCGSNFWGERVEHKNGGGITVEGGYPSAQHWTKAHSLKNKIHPLQADSIICMKEV